MTERLTDDTTLIKRRIEAIVMQAMLNADEHGGDEATAAMDIITAFVLLCTNAGTSADQMMTATFPHARNVVSDFWPTGRIN